ncbi:putative acyl esterase [Saccharothrix coeruleofusca]|uniref:CocE/NonD family hydrolase n=1 Tax=Saccharothrix coeruleofusca TaxID=33919 RepID=UPI0027DE52C9|nr:CocE/NonD family hydrolase [Saccharothrix coeruleofusca]MBP2340901.1 putative acyl esterase [Saccharothrix coeruleofusca]
MRRSPLLALLCLLLLAPPAHAAPGFQVSHHTIPGQGGTPLPAFVVEPTGRGGGPFPLLVLPSSWSMNAVEYVGAAARLAYESGYVVVSYTSRGFHDAGGEIDVAGPDTVADVSRVIDWAVAHARGDATRVGVGGISYGAGQSLLAAAADPRVKAVAALSTWTDLARSLYPNETVSAQAVELLLAAGKLTGRPGPELREAEAAYRAGRFADVLPISPPRSPATRVADIDAAVLIGNAWNDGLFPPSQITDFFTALDAPKRLMLSPGDHATAELFGAAGLPNEIWASVGRWFDHHLRGLDNGVDREAPVRLKPNNGGGWRSFPSWGAVTTRRDTVPLTAARIGTGRPTLADSGAVLVSGALQGFLQIPTGVATPLIDRTAAAVWHGPAHSTATTVSGTPRAHLAVTASAPTTLHAYLYEVNALGLGALVTHKPVTVGAGTHALDLDLEPVVWEVAAGNRLVLAVDTVDARYGGVSRWGGTVGFGADSWLEVPRP